MSASRQQRLAIAHRAERVLARLHGLPIRCEPDATPKTHVILAAEGVTPGRVRRLVGEALDERAREDA